MNLLEAPRPVLLAGDKRTHRLGDDAEGERIDRAAAVPPPQAKETAMPSGVYPRKPRAAKSDQPGEGKPVTEKRKKPGVKKAKGGKVVARLASTSSTEPNFVVDDAGRIAIIDGTTRIDLSVSSTRRLVQFMDRTKSFRS